MIGRSMYHHLINECYTRKFSKEHVRVRSFSSFLIFFVSELLLFSALLKSCSHILLLIAAMYLTATMYSTASQFLGAQFVEGKES